jgi:hypothetical protein
LLGGVLFVDYIVFKYWDCDYKKVQKYKDAVIQGSRRYYVLYKLKRKCNLDFNAICLDQYIYADLGSIKTFKVFNYLTYLRKCLIKGSVYKRFLTFDQRYQQYRSSMKDLPDFTDEESFKKRFPDGNLDYKTFRKFEEKICKYYDFNVTDDFICTVEISYTTRIFQILEEQSFGYNTIIILCRMIDENKNFTSGYYRTIFNMSECTRFILKGA